MQTRRLGEAVSAVRGYSVSGAPTLPTEVAAGHEAGASVCTGQPRFALHSPVESSRQSLVQGERRKGNKRERGFTDACTAPRLILTVRLRLRWMCTQVNCSGERNPSLDFDELFAWEMIFSEA